MSKPAKVHKIKAKVDPKSTKTSSKVTKIKASVPAKTAKTAKTAKSAKLTAKTVKSAKLTAKTAKPTAKATKTVSATKTTAVTKIKAVIKSKTAKRVKSKKALAKALKPMVGFNRYLKNSWLELKKVHWPSRKSTWAMVFAVVSYSLFFLVLVLALDNFFSYIFKLMLK